MKYTDPDWAQLIKDELKERKLLQKDFARMLGKTPNALRMMMSRDNLGMESIRELSRVLERDFVELLLSEESRTLLASARRLGLHPGQEAIEELIEEGLVEQKAQIENLEERIETLRGENQDLAVEKARLEGQLQQKDTELRASFSERERVEEGSQELKGRLNEAKDEQEAIKALHREAMAEKDTELEGKDEQLAAKDQELSKKDKVLKEKQREIEELKMEMKEVSYNAKLEISVLKAKLEILTDMQNKD